MGLDSFISRTVQGAGNGLRRFWSVVAIVLVAETAAILAFYGLEWTWLRSLHIAWLRTALEPLGCQVQTAGTLLTVEGRHFQIDPDCTYVDLILCSLPFLWRVNRRWTTSLGVLAAFAAGVLAANLVRVLYGVYAFSHGVSMFWAHDLPDYILWYPTMGVVALLWLRSLRALWPDVGRACQPPGSADFPARFEAPRPANHPPPQGVVPDVARTEARA